MRAGLVLAGVVVAGCGRVDFDPRPGDTTVLAPDACPTDARLQACWDFEGDLDDKSGNGNDAIGTGTAFVDGPFGLALQTTETSRGDLVAPSLDMLQYTIDAWIRPEAPVTSFAIAFDHHSHFAFGVRPVDATHVRINCDVSGDTAQAGTPSPVGQWTRVVCRNDGDVLTLFVDGVAQGTASGLTSIEAMPAAIGGNAPPDDAYAPYIGLIDRLRIWNVALTPDELDAID